VPLQVRHEIVDGAVVVHARGEVDMSTRKLLDLQLQAAESQVVPPAPVVLDLTGVTFLASMGLSLLIEHRELCAEFGSRLFVVATDRAVLRPIQLTGLDEELMIVATVQAALTAAS
jgi:anti-sigma B factor antagonist